MTAAACTALWARKSATSGGSSLQPSTAGLSCPASSCTCGSEPLLSVRAWCAQRARTVRLHSLKKSPTRKFRRASYSHEGTRAALQERTAHSRAPYVTAPAASSLPPSALKCRSAGRPRCPFQAVSSSCHSRDRHLWPLIHAMHGHTPSRRLQSVFRLQRGKILHVMMR